MRKTSPKPVVLYFCFEHIGFKSPGGNAIKKMPSWKYRQLRKQIRKLLIRFFWDEYVNKGLKRPTFSQAKVACTYIATTQRKRDYENLAFTFKPWLDELQELNVLEGDDMDLIGKPEYNVEVGKKYGIRIEIKSPEE